MTESVRVGDVLAIQRRAVNVEIDQSYEEIGIRSFGRGVFHKEPVSGATLGSKRVFRIEPDDLLLSNVFAWEGAIAVAGESERGKIGSHRFMTFTPTDGRIDTTWASWFFRSEPGLELIRGASPGSAGRNRTLAIDRFENLEIPLPPVDEQRRAAAQLDRISATSDQVSNLTADASNVASALGVSLAVRPDLKPIAKAAAGWRPVTLGEFAAQRTELTQVRSAERYRIAGLYSFGKGFIDRGQLFGDQTSYKALTALKFGDIVVSKLGGWEGAVGVVGEEFDGFYVSSEFPTFAIDKSVVRPEYLRCLTQWPELWRQIADRTQGSMARRKRITPTQFLGLKVWLPPIAVQERVIAAMEYLDATSRLRNGGERRTRALTAAAMNATFAWMR